MDAGDPLRSFRDRFLLPDGVIYLDGNSLGALPRATPDRVACVLREEWGRSLIRAWNDHGWIDLPRRVGDKIGRLIGAEPGSTVVAELHVGEYLQVPARGFGVTTGPAGDPDRNG